MARIAYVNGRYVPLGRAEVNVEDRGYQFGDSIYEVVPVYAGTLIDEDPHLDRLDRSLDELRMAPAMSRAALKAVAREVLRRNRIRHGLLYMQFSRAVAPRGAPFPADPVTQIVMTARRAPPLQPERMAEGVSILTMPDIRWGRRDIKTVNLLPNLLAKQRALDEGYDDAWQVDDAGYVTEGSASNAWIVNQEKQVITRPRTQDILWGITRRRVMELADDLGVRYVERPFSVDEATAAREAFLTSATSYLTAVTSIDGHVIGNGRAGFVTMALAERYLEQIKAAARAA